jgi:hypothetical protein
MLKRINNLKKRLSNILRLNEDRIDKIDLHSSFISQEIQVLLKLKYKEYLVNREVSSLPTFDEVGFKAYSQFEEDGILLYIFSTIGTETKKVVEICAGDGKECMATNLIINHGWEGYLFDGSPEKVRQGQDFFSKHQQTFLRTPTFKQAWFNAENVNSILENTGAVGEVDLLSLDIDGMDYWVWQAIECIQPRVCVFETNNTIPADLSLTAKYDPNFNYLNQLPIHRDYRSASLLATQRISAKKGYRLIGSHRHGFNCFFMRNDIGQNYFPEVSVESCHDNPYTRDAQKYRWPSVRDLDWHAV